MNANELRTVNEILNLTEKQSKEFEEIYNSGTHIIKMGADEIHFAARLLSEELPIYLDLHFYKENSKPVLKKFKSLDSESYWKLVKELNN